MATTLQTTLQIIQPGVSLLSLSDASGNYEVTHL